VSLVARWVDLIYKVATGGWRAKLILAPIAGALYLSLIVFFVLLSLAVDQWLSFPKAFSYPLSLVVGFCLIVFGL
jgi:ascorbate-specific PTS system EIIC-type component UlaA